MKKSINKRITIITMIIISVGIFYGCSPKAVPENKDELDYNNEVSTNKVFKNVDKISAWVTYWDSKVESEVLKLSNQLNELCYFAAHYDENGKLIVPEELNKIYNEVGNDNYINYLSVVNDVIYHDGTSSLKDITLVSNILDNNGTRSKEINNIINLALKYNFQGIEIDYEQIGKNLDLWNKFILFIDELNIKALENNLKLRIVLEPNTPFESLEFHKGPTYVMMCYNLHGGFSEPGEKTNSNFIKELIDKMSKVPGEKNFAIPSGGIDWASDGKVKSITEVEAKSIAREYDSKERRDEESNCLVYTYLDSDGISHEVWYADENTLDSWFKIISDNGYEASLWRLGHNLFEMDPSQ